MNRRSIVGPFILIVLGALFLANNLRPELAVFDLIADYWPFLLIIWGFLRLVEVLVFAASSRPLPQRGFSGGEIFLIVLICLAGSGLFMAKSFHIPHIRLGPRTMEILGETFDYPLSLTRAAPDKPRIVFQNLKGNVRVTGADIREVRISGRKVIRAYNRADADKANDQTPLEIVVDGDRVTVRTNQEKVSDDRRLTADLEVTVPRGSSVEGHGRLGDFDITGIDGSVDIASENAGVRLNQIGGNARIDLKRSDIVRAVSMKGNIEVLGKGSDIEFENIEGTASVNGSFGGNLEFKNIAKALRYESRNTDMRVERLPGRISMDLGSLSGTNLVGPVRLSTKSRDVKFEEFTQSLELDLERGDVELRPRTLPLAKIDAHIRSTGNIELTLPEAGKFELTASTDKGEVRNDFGPPILTNTEGRTATMKGKTGIGPILNVTTTRGTVTVRK